MTVVYRCRTVMSEVAGLFGAVVPSNADWSAEVWPGRTGLVVHESEGERRIATMAWGVHDWSRGHGAKEVRTGAWFRELFRGHVDLLARERRCLIVLDSFAYPDGLPGTRTRTWFGFEERPVFAWAGFWTENRNGPAFCGFLQRRTNLSRRAASCPRSSHPWLAGDLTAAARIARTTVTSEEMYREPTEEPWGGDRGG